MSVLQLIKVTIILLLMTSPLRADLIDSDEEAVKSTHAPSPSPVSEPHSNESPTQHSGSDQSKSNSKAKSDKTSSRNSKTESQLDKKDSGATNQTQRTVLAPTVKKQKARKKGPNQDPIAFESKGARALKAEGLLELEQDVVIKQGNMRLEANRAEVYYDEVSKDVKQVFAEGEVKMFKTDEDTGERIQAFGDTVTFLNDQRKITVEGNARLWRGKDLVRGKRIVYELDTGWIRADRVVGEVHATDPNKKP